MGIFLGTNDYDESDPIGIVGKITKLNMEHAAIEANLRHFLLVLSVSLGVATFTQIFSWFRQIPYTLLLVIAGLGLAIADVRLVSLSPELILFIFLPPLLFEAAWNLQWSHLKRHLVPICLYVIIGVPISIAGIAFALHQLLGLPLITAALIGASLAATDPVSVVALFRELGVKQRLLTLVEGESLFNDGMAVVSFSFLVSIPLGNADVGLLPIVVQFFTVVGTGIGVGGLLGFSVSYLTQRFDSPLVEQSLTLISAYSSYLMTENLGGSGVIGVVTTGLILGNFGSRIGMNPRTQIIVTEFWGFLAFFVNSIVFLLIGDQVLFDFLRKNMLTIAVTVGAMILTRAIVVYGLSFFSRRANTKIPITEQTVIWWSGLRGSVSIALALSVPAVNSINREAIISTVFGAVLFTLLVQGLTVKPLLSGLNLLSSRSRHQEFKEHVAHLIALDRVLQHLNQMKQRPGVDPEFYDYQKTMVKGELEQLRTEIEQMQKRYPDLQSFADDQLRAELLAIEMNAYAELVRQGHLNKELASLLCPPDDRFKRK
jgi:CPA1 family monovalent cation:H+ antiporter